jgi:hypothetical protein
MIIIMLQVQAPLQGAISCTLSTSAVGQKHQQLQEQT